MQPHWSNASPPSAPSKAALRHRLVVISKGPPVPLDLLGVEEHPLQEFIFRGGCRA